MLLITVTGVSLLADMESATSTFVVRRSERRRVPAAGRRLATMMRTAYMFFSPSFGMVADCFGVSWMLYVAP